MWFVVILLLCMFILVFVLQNLPKLIKYKKMYLTGTVDHYCHIFHINDYVELRFWLTSASRVIQHETSTQLHRAVSFFSAECPPFIDRYAHQH